MHGCCWTLSCARVSNVPLLPDFPVRCAAIQAPGCVALALGRCTYLPNVHGDLAISHIELCPPGYCRDYLPCHSRALYTGVELMGGVLIAIQMIVSLTALITLSVNTFYGWRIHKLSKHNWWLTGPIAFLSIVRVGLALTTTTEMFIEKTFPAFGAKFKILFTSGLAISAVTDIIVSAARYYYLRNVRQGYSMNHEAVDAVVIFTINDGCLTCGVVLASIACWLSMPHNFVYLAIYFSIAKLYSNSVLATLNLRNWYRHRYVGSRPLGIPMKRPGGASNEPNSIVGGSLPAHRQVTSTDMNGLPGKMEVFVDHQVEYNVGDFPRGDRYDGDGHSNKSINIA